MSRLQVTWVVRTENGQVKGPFSTEAILRMIGDGIFTGQELISKLPDGKWTLISKEPEFYDCLLEALEGVVEVDPQRKQKMQAETVIMTRPTEHSSPSFSSSNTLSGTKTSALQKISDEKIVEVLANSKNPQAPPLQHVPPLKKLAGAKSIIDMSNLDRVERMEALKKIKIPLAILGALIVLAVGFAFMGNDTPGEKISLLAPGRGAAPLSESQVKSKLASALAAIEKDTFENYLQAENQLVSIVEGAPSNLEVRALLCLVYKELWPFTKQDATDIKVISSMTQSTKALNVVSPYGNMCEITKLLTAGRYKEARGVVESTLETVDRFSLLPVLYLEKAELLEGDKDISNAIPYYEKSVQLWDHWLKPQVQLGAVLAQNNRANEGASLLRRVLELNPNHKAARIQLGLIEYRQFKKNDNAFDLLASGVDSHGSVNRALESQGYQALAEISVEKGEKRKALSFAQKGFELNPNNVDARQLVLRLGGTDKIKADKNQNNELVFMGDQYVRQGDCLAAQAEFKAAFEIDRKNGTAAMKAAKCLWQLSQSFEAIDWLNKAIKAEPKLISAYVLQADYMTQRFDFLGAMQILTSATRFSPNNYEVLRGLGLLEYRKNNMPATINYALRSLKAYDGDVETYILLAKANSQLAAGITPIKSVDVEKKENARKDSIRYATKAVELDAMNAEAQITYAKMLAQVNGVDSGINYMKELIKKFSYSSEYRVALAEIYKTEDRFTQAQEIYEQVVDADPKNKKGWLGLGECYRALGLNDKALRAYLSAAVLDPTDGEALFQAGKVYLETGRFDEAIQQFRRVQSLNPFFPRTFYYIGRSAFASGDFGVALEAAKSEKRQNPNLADSYLLAAETYYARRQFTECAAEYSQAMKLRPQGAEIYVRAGQCYRLSGSIDVAEDMLALAAARESGFADIYREQGAIYEAKGDVVSAIQSYNKYLGLSPNAPDRKDIESKISRIGGR